MGIQNVHFLHVGKTGGTAVKSALKDHLHTRNQKIILHGHNYTLMHVPKGEKVFFFLRDPISRFISGFYSRQRKGQPRYFYDWNEGEKRAFNFFNTPNELAIALSDDNPVIQEEARLAMKNIRHVQNLYSYWYKNEEYFLSRLNDILFIGRQETLSQDFSQLKTLLNLPRFITLPSHDDLNAHRNPQQLDRRLENEAVKNLMEWYTNDYSFLELCTKFADNINYSG